MLDQLLKKYIPRLLRRMHREFKVPVDKQKKMLNSFKEPADDFERSYYQYVCQRLFWGRLFYFGASAASIVLLPLKLRQFKKMVGMSGSIEDEKTDLVLVADEMPDGIFPHAIIDSYNSKIRVGAMDGFYFDEEDLRFFETLKGRYRWHPYFLYKCLMKQAGYSYIIHRYKPECITTCGGEFTYTSSFLTEYCNQKGVEHFNTMHGEMFYYILDAFSHFNRFYVWDEYYADLLISLRAKSEFVVALPDSVKMNLEEVDIAGLRTYDYKYYLQMQDGDVLKNIADSILKLKEKGASISVRYHPRTINLDEIKRVMPGVDLENPREISIDKSIASARNVVGLNSTVLFQTYISGGNVIIDDVSNRDLFIKLKEMQYMMINKCHLLSEYI